MKFVVALAIAAVWVSSIALAQDNHCTDAEILALEQSGSLSPPEDLTSAIDADLQAIREFDPFFEEIHVRPAVAPSLLQINLTPEAMLEFRAGTYHGFDELNDLYGPVEMRGLSLIDWVILDFESCYHPVPLVPLYSVVPGVIGVSTSGPVGDGDDITILEAGRYLFRHGWEDCPSGCLYTHHWVITVAGGIVQVIEEYGDPVATQALRWGDVKATFR